MTDGGPEWFSARELASRIGALIWVEETVGRVMSAWSRDEPANGLGPVWFEMAEHHRWHAELLRELLPTSPALIDDAAEGAPSEGWRRAVGVFVTLDDSAARVHAARRLVSPWITREIVSLTELANPIADRAMVRRLGFCELDHDNDGARLESAVASLPEQPISLDAQRRLASVDLTVTPA